MKKLLLLSLLSSAVCAMSPARLAMSDDAPSFISKEGHKFCGGVCCATMSSLPAIFFVVAARGTFENNWEKCVNTRGCDPYKKYAAAQVLSPILIPPLIALSAVGGYVVGSQLGEVTYEIDQSLKAVLSKEKTE